MNGRQEERKKEQHTHTQTHASITIPSETAQRLRGVDWAMRLDLRGKLAGQCNRSLYQDIYCIESDLSSLL